MFYMYIFRYVYLYVQVSMQSTVIINRIQTGHRQIKMGVDECVWVRWGAGYMVYTKNKTIRIHLGSYKLEFGFYDRIKYTFLIT